MNRNFDEVVNREGTDCIKYDLREDIFGRKDIIPMWVADMDFRTPGFITEILPVRPEATYMIWLDCRKFDMSGKELQSFFVHKTGVGMNEGSTFGPGGEGFMRMNIAAPRSKVEKAMQQIEAAVAVMR